MRKEKDLQKISEDVRYLEQKYKRQPKYPGIETEVPTFDFTEWTEVDPNNNLSQTSTRASWTNMLSAEGCYIYKAASFGLTFEHQLDFRLTSIDVNVDEADALIAAIWSINQNSGRLGHSESGAGVRIWIQENGTSTTDFTLYLNHADDTYQDISVLLTVGTTYYLTITRATNVYTCKIYSDSSRTALIDTLTIDLTGETEDSMTFNYAETTAGKYGNYRPNEQSDGYIENWTY